MTYDVHAKQFFISAHWPERREEPESIADRLRHFLDSIGKIDETLAPWSIGRRRRVPYRAFEQDLPALIRRDVRFDEDGKPELVSGYSIQGTTTDKRQRYMMVGSAGGTYDGCNGILLQTDSDGPVDPSIVTYAVMKALMLSMIACWTPAFCRAGLSVLKPDPDRVRAVVYSWMFYVKPADVKDVDLVGIPFSERTPDGGILLSATNEVFDVENAGHMEGARLISQATQHLDATAAASD